MKPTRCRALGLVLIGSLAATAAGADETASPSRPAPPTRQGGATGKGPVKDDEAIRVLISELRYGSDMERAKAAFELQRFGEKAVAPLVDELAVTGPRTAVWVLAVLAELDGARVEPAIRRCLDHGDPRVRCAASGALSRRGLHAGDRALSVLRKGETGERRVLVANVAGSGIRGFEVLVRALRDEDWAVRSQARRALISRIEEGNGSGGLDASRLAADLIEMYERPLPGPRADVLTVLSWLEGDEVDLLFLRVLDRNPEPDLRAAAAAALGRRKDPDLMRPLIRSCKEDPSSRVRLAAVRSLASLGGIEAAPYLIKGLHDPDRRVRDAARAALTELAGVDHGTRYWAWMEWWRGLPASTRNPGAPGEEEPAAASPDGSSPDQSQ